MDRMENKSDTEIEEAHVMLPPKKKLRNDPPSKSHKTFEPRDFNALITSAAMDLQETEAGTNQDQDVPLDSSIGDQQIIFVEPQCTITEGQMTDSSQLIYLNTNSTTSGATGSAELQAIIANQNTIKDNQTKMMKSMANMQTTLNFLVDSVAQNEVPQKVQKQKEPGNEIINPIDCLEDLSNLEKYLDNEYNLQKLSTSMGFICGTSGKAQGIDCCYKLVDYFFTRRFLTQCSWTGAARLTDGNAGQQESGPSTSADVAGKVPLKFFKKNSAVVFESCNAG
ncbi:hypothetical protein RP20_CCG010571 [Aedes albopictus]|nr:hypothetical protein RP20_CCG010571 [Aedes albopictus]